MEVEKETNKIGCIIMASGEGKRFGSNKLLVDFCGKSLIQRILDTTEALFEKRVVVTRSEEVRDICTRQNINVILHKLPYRNDTIRLGMGALEEMEACVFCSSDQPLLRKESLKKLRKSFMVHKSGIHRLFFEEQEGMPILFGKEYFEELKNLPEKAGGGYLIKKYPQQVVRVSVADEAELLDVDTPEELEKLLQIADGKNRSGEVLRNDDEKNSESSIRTSF